MGEHLLGLLQVLDFELVSIQIYFLLLQLLLYFFLLNLQLMDLGVPFLNEVTSILLLEFGLIRDVSVHRGFFLFAPGLSLDGLNVISNGSYNIIQLLNFLGVHSFVLIYLILVLIFVLSQPLLKHELVAISCSLGILILILNILQIDSEFAEEFLN